MSSSLQSYGLGPSRPLCPSEFSRQEHWSGLPCPRPADLPDPGIEPTSLMSLSLADRFFTTSTIWEAPIYPDKAIISKDTYTSMFIAALCKMARTWKQPKCSLTEERINRKRCSTYTMEYYSATKKNKIVPFAETYRTAHRVK